MKRVGFTLLLLVTFNLTLLSPVNADIIYPEEIRTPERLLAVVNTKLKEMHLPAFEMEGLIVCLAKQSQDGSENDYNGKRGPRVESLLEDLLAKRKFRFPVHVALVESDRIFLTYNVPAREIATPAYRSLEVMILNVPYNSVDSEGNKMRVDWTNIVLATALDKKSNKQK